MVKFYLISIAILFSASAGVTEEAASPKPLPDGFVLSAVDGRVSVDDQDRWSFAPDEDITAEQGGITAQQKIPMLPNSVLEKLTADIEHRKSSDYRLWAIVTRYENENFIFASYFLPLAARQDEAEQIDEQPEKDQDSDNGYENDDEDRSDELSLPSEILEQFERQRTIEAPRQYEPAEPAIDLGDDRMLVGRTGVLEEVDKNIAFRIKGVGLKGSEGDTFELLPNSALELAQRRLRILPARARFEVTGLVTEYEGRQYILLVRASRIHGYGNFDL